MKRPVASFFLLVSLLLPTAAGQTRDQGARKQSPSRSNTLKICQGVALPDGYVIVGYVSSSLCPHGAYLLKKQDSPQRQEAPRANAVSTDTNAVTTAPREAAQPTTPTRSGPRRVGTDGEVLSTTNTAQARPPVLGNAANIAVPVSASAETTPTTDPQTSSDV